MGTNSDAVRSKVASFPRDALEQAETVKEGWAEVGGKLSVPNLTIGKFEDKLGEAKECAEKAEKLKLARAQAIQHRNGVLGELWDLTKRVRNAAKATFGDQSSELERLNSTRQDN